MGSSCRCVSSPWKYRDPKCGCSAFVFRAEAGCGLPISCYRNVQRQFRQQQHRDGAHQNGKAVMCVCVKGAARVGGASPHHLEGCPTCRRWGNSLGSLLPACCLSGSIQAAVLHPSTHPLAHLWNSETSSLTGTWDSFTRAKLRKWVRNFIMPEREWTLAKKIK